MDCQTCNGNGETSCPVCSGECDSHGRVCECCKGEGYIDCQRCSGTGFLEWNF